MNINQLDICVNIQEENEDLKFIQYQVQLNGNKYNLEDIVFVNNFDQIKVYQEKLQKMEFLAFIVNRCKIIPINLFKICVCNLIINNEKYNGLKIIDEQQIKIHDLILKASQESIQECYQILNIFKSQLQRIVYLHQIVMVDTFTKVEQRIQFIQDCIDYLSKYKYEEGSHISQYIQEKKLFALNDLFRLQSSLMRKDLCQTTLFQLQQQSGILQNLNIQTRIIRLQLDFNQTEYIYTLNKKVQINMQNISEILQTLKLLDIYDINKKLHQIPVIQQNNQEIIYQINDYLIKIMQIIFGSLQLQENSLLGELLQQHKQFFAMVCNLQIRYTYHICLSLTMQQQEALENSLKAFQLAVEINDINDIIEIFINTQLLYIETDQEAEGLKFSQQFIDNFGSQKIKLSHKAEYKQIEDNMTYMMVKLRMNE
ncbi:unnamed protein product [Paramecium pentaurelia]|uniref:Uncharacterized protein n=1 Tax=Paramecium pentaurelia TaxID=43138 RepID=A0A8S1S946_9CILI|nr:unnamed protein product [Paramecium pentaurelia]